MEQTTLQKRIEERAKQKLLKDLYAAAEKEVAIANMFNSYIYDSNKSNVERLWEQKLNVTERHYSYSSESEIRIGNEYSQKVFDTLLPKYIIDVTDEILKKIDEIDYLVSNNKMQEADY